MEPGILVAMGLLLVLAGGFAVLALRFPVLVRMGVRNALRRRWQSLVVVAGLMVGTAILAGSLASGDSLTFGIRKGAYDALGPADAFVQMEGQLHFPRVVYDDLRANASVREATAAMSPLLYEEAALRNPAAKQSEPRVSLIGFEPEAHRPFGPFHSTDGRLLDGSDLGPADVYLGEELARKLDARAGDVLSLHYGKAPLPRVPRVEVFEGTLTASAGVCPLPELCPGAGAPGDVTAFEVPVLPGALSMTSLLAWEGPNAARADLDQLVRAPDGRAWANADGTPLQPDNPSLLNVTGPLDAGTWTLEVRAKAAVGQPFRAVVLVFYEEYNLTAIQAFARDAQRAGFDPEQLGAGLQASPAETADLTVRAVVTDEGFGGFLLNDNVFARQDAVARLYGVEGRLNMVLLSADLDPYAGADKAARMAEVVWDAVNASAAAHPDAPALEGVKVAPVKARWLEAADRAGSLFKEFLTTIGSFTVIAGIMLIINIFVMLAEERKAELGMARAVGLARRQLVLLFAFEGFFYALVASFLGVWLGLGLAYGLIRGLNDIFSANAGETGALDIPFHVEPTSLFYAFVAGLAITMTTVAVASWRVSRLNVVRAIRRMEEPPRRAGRAVLAWGLVLLAGGTAWALYGLLAEGFVARVLGPPTAFLGAGMVASRFAPRRWAYPLAGAAVASYSAWSLFRLGNPEGLVNRIMGPVRGVFIVLAVVLILIHLPGLVRAVAALLLRIRALVPSVRPGVAYPLEKKTRTGLTVTMFALVLLVVVAFSIFGATFNVDLESQSGGYDVDGDTTVPVGDLRAFWSANRDPGAADPWPRIERVDELRYALAFGGRLVKIEGEDVHYQGPPVDYVYAYDEDFARHNRYGFVSLDPAYRTEEEAYLAVLRDPSLVIVSSLYNFDEMGQPGRHRVGDTLTLELAGQTSSFRIIGFQKQLYLGGIFVHPQVLEGNFQRVRGEYLFKLHEGEDPRVAAQEIEAAFERAGMNAESLEEKAAQQLEQNRRFLSLFQLFLGFGLVVGIASLGIVTARSVLERRQEIGMLRAVGYGRGHVLRMLYVEIFLTTTLGILVGGAIGVLTSYGVVTSTPDLESLGVTFVIPWGDLLRIVALVYVAVFLATLLPARQGSRVPPAEAVRYVE